MIFCLCIRSQKSPNSRQKKKKKKKPSFLSHNAKAIHLLASLLVTSSLNSGLTGHLFPQTWDLNGDYLSLKVLRVSDWVLFGSLAQSDPFSAVSTFISGALTKNLTMEVRISSIHFLSF